MELPHTQILRRGLAADAGQVVGGVAPGGGVEAAIQGDGVALAAQHALHFHDLVGDGQCGASVVGRGGVIGLVWLLACCRRRGLVVVRGLCLPESLDPLAGGGQVRQGFLGAVDPGWPCWRAASRVGCSFWWVPVTQVGRCCLAWLASIWVGDRLAR